MGFFICDKVMPEQEFRELVNGLKPKLRKVCAKNRFLGFIDKDDLYQEALISLWSRFESGKLAGKTESYIVRGCYFHIQNYIRTHTIKSGILSLEEPAAPQEDGAFCLKDVIVDASKETFRQVNSRLIVDELLHNGLTKREKDVFMLLYEGWNLRETARRLGISHVRVLKIKRNIRHKYGPRYRGAL